MKLNNKGFTLIEVLAVLVILGILVAFMYPNVTKLINNNREENITKIKESIKDSAKLYMSDHRYDIKVNTNDLKENSQKDQVSILKVGEQIITDSKILVSYLEKEGNIKTDPDGNIYNPQNKSECLNKEESYIIVTYNYNKKDFNYDNEPILKWTKDCN